TVHEPRPFGEMSNAHLTAVTNSFDTIWTSLTTGRDYRIRRDADYIYTDWINKPSQLDASAFRRSELKKGSDGHWHGKAHSFLPCQYQDYWTGAPSIKWCRVDSEMEIDLLSESRIEGFSQSSEKFDCRKCESKNIQQERFTWIPKN